MNADLIEYDRAFPRLVLTHKLARSNKVAVFHRLVNLGEFFHNFDLYRLAFAKELQARPIRRKDPVKDRDREPDDQRMPRLHSYALTAFCSSPKRTEITLETPGSCMVTPYIT